MRLMRFITSSVFLFAILLIFAGTGCIFNTQLNSQSAIPIKRGVPDIIQDIVEEDSGAYKKIIVDEATVAAVEIELEQGNEDFAWFREPKEVTKRYAVQLGINEEFKYFESPAIVENFYGGKTKLFYSSQYLEGEKYGYFLRLISKPTNTIEGKPVPTIWIPSELIMEESNSDTSINRVIVPKWLDPMLIEKGFTYYPVEKLSWVTYFSVDKPLKGESVTPDSVQLLLQNAGEVIPASVSYEIKKYGDGREEDIFVIRIEILEKNEKARQKDCCQIIFDGIETIDGEVITVGYFLGWFGWTREFLNGGFLPK